MMLIALTFAAVGVAIGSGLQDMQGFQLIMNFLVLPIYFLSGAMFPLADQKLPLRIATGIDPLSYGVDGLRSALLGASFHSQFTDFAVLAVLAVILMIFGAWRFSKIEI
jgi:ABC-2 type transport system permease protein